MIFRRKAAQISRCTGAVLAVVLAVAVPSPVFADDAINSQAVSALSPREKSLLFPGWGQIAERRILKGAAFAAAELACLVGAIHYNAGGNSAYDQYKAAGDAASAVRYRKLVERNDGRRNACLLAAAAVWAVNLLDIHLLVNRKGAGPASRSFTIGITHGPSSAIGLSVDCRF
jgi:hypothetical protein